MNGDGVASNRDGNGRWIANAKQAWDQVWGSRGVVTVLPEQMSTPAESSKKRCTCLEFGLMLAVDSEF